MKVGTRLTLALLLALTPVLFGRMYWVASRSSVVYTNDLKRDIRVASRSLAPALENDIRQKEFDQVDDILRRMSDETTTFVLLNPEGKVWRAPGKQALGLSNKLIDSRGVPIDDSEFEARIDGRDWFCREVLLNDTRGGLLGYLLVAQDWTDLRQDLRTRVETSIIATMGVLAVVVLVIPFLVRRYVSKPLAELSLKVTEFSRDETRDTYTNADELRMLTEEFRKLAEQLNVARRDLLAKHKRELELERSLQHAERLATVGTLASGLAHEIGTPMGVIRGRAEQILRGEPVSERARKGLEIIISQIDRVSRIVRMLLDYGRSRESHRSLHDVRQIVTNAMSLLETEAARRQVSVVADLGDAPLWAECDAGQLQQVFVNLELNALDAMAAQQGGALNIRARALSNGEGGGLELVFEDTGPGVSPQAASRVFDPFFTTKEPGNGTGMGLAVSQSIIRDHNGEISFETGPGGSKFYVKIPGVAGALDKSTTPAPVKENRA